MEETFPSQNAAAKFLGCSANSLRASFCGKMATIAGRELRLALGEPPSAPKPAGGLDAVGEGCLAAAALAASAPKVSLSRPAEILLEEIKEPEDGQVQADQHDALAAPQNGPIVGHANFKVHEVPLLFSHAQHKRVLPPLMR